jgi:hypothetical protein
MHACTQLQWVFSTKGAYAIRPPEILRKWTVSKSQGNLTNTTKIIY